MNGLEEVFCQFFKELEWWINFIEKNTFLGLDKYPDETTLKLACMDREL